MAIKQLSELPLILAGPILRRVTKDSVCVWLALKTPSAPTLGVQNQAGTALPGQSSVKSTKIGSHLHIVVAEFKPRDALVEDQVYSYNLQFAEGDLMATGVYASVGSPSSKGLAYRTFGPPTFVIPRTDVTKVRLVQGSCRKPHADSIDAMVLLDDAIEQSASPDDRPQQLFLTGDQIYADDVSDSLLQMIQQTAALLIGAPGSDGGPTIPTDSQSPGMRSKFAKSIGLTSEPPAEKSHLFTFAEYCAMYLLTWSDVIWPGTQPNTQLPTFEDIYHRPGVFKSDDEEFVSAEAQEFQRENTALTSFYRSLPLVRRALANIATYMLLDDHEVCDDLFINRQWITDIVKGSEQAKGAGKAVVRNGLLAYALFQAHGNEGIESRFDSLLASVDAWATGNLKENATELVNIEALLGVPSGAPATDDVYPRAKDASSGKQLQLRWHYHLTFPNYEVFALDGRTQRFYPEGSLTAAGLIGQDSLDQQIPKSPAPTWAAGAGNGVTFVITPGPWNNLSYIEDRQKKPAAQEGVYENDVELLHLNNAAYDGLIARLAERDPNNARVVVLCGDVHYAFSSRLQYWSASKNPQTSPVETPPQPNQAVFAQMLSSALKNQGVPVLLSSLALHYSGFRLALREMTRLGWHAPGADDFIAGTGTVVTPHGPTTHPNWNIPVRNGFAISELDRERAIFTNVTPNANAINNLAWQVQRVLYHGGDKPTAAEQVNGVVDFLAAIIKVLFNWLFQYIFVGMGGRDVVGVNNIGILKIVRSPQDQSLSVEQELLWFNASRDTLYNDQASATGNVLQHKTSTHQAIPLTLEPEPALSTIEF